MKYSIINRDDPQSAIITDQFHRLAQNAGMVHDESEPGVVVSIGGDGTMLHAFHSYVDRLERTSFVGVHTGHLGFYADWKPDQIEQMVQLMSPGNHVPRLVHYPLLEIEIINAAGTRSSYALNEFTLKGAAATLVAQLDINDESFEMFRGDGICISTPSGSTAYNKSVGGALIHPALETIQIAEIASINNRVFRTVGSSMVLPRHHHCDIYPREGQQLLITVDHLSEKLDDLVSIRCQVSSRKVGFVRYRPFPFWKRVKDAFISNDDME